MIDMGAIEEDKKIFYSWVIKNGKVQKDVESVKVREIDIQFYRKKIFPNLNKGKITRDELYEIFDITSINEGGKTICEITIPEDVKNKFLKQFPNARTLQDIQKCQKYPNYVSPEIKQEIAKEKNNEYLAKYSNQFYSIWLRYGALHQGNNSIEIQEHLSAFFISQILARINKNIDTKIKPEDVYEFFGITIKEDDKKMHTASINVPQEFIDILKEGTYKTIPSKVNIKGDLNTEQVEQYTEQQREQISNYWKTKSKEFFTTCYKRGHIDEENNRVTVMQDAFNVSIFRRGLLNLGFDEDCLSTLGIEYETHEVNNYNRSKNEIVFTLPEEIWNEFGHYCNVEKLRGIVR